MTQFPQDTKYLKYQSSFQLGPSLGDFITDNHGNFTPFYFKANNYHDFEMPETTIDVYELKGRLPTNLTFADIFRSIGVSNTPDLRIRFGQLVELFQRHRDFMVQTKHQTVFLVNVFTEEGQGSPHWRGGMKIRPAMCGFNLEYGSLQGPIRFTAANDVSDMVSSWAPNKEKSWRIIVPRLDSK